MFELHTEIEIDAPADVVWGILADFEAYPSWNPFIRRIAGELADGARLEAILGAPGAKPMTFRPHVVRLVPGRHLGWLGRLAGVPHLFDGEHSFVIEPLDDARVRFVQSERFGGMLLPFLKKALETSTRAGFEAMNLALKRRAEERASDDLAVSQ